MSYAIIRAGGKQYRVHEGDRVKIEKVVAEVGETIEIKEVLALGEGGNLKFAKAALEGKTIEAKVVRHLRGPKIRIWKFKRRQGYEKRQGHRQDYTEVVVLSIPACE